MDTFTIEIRLEGDMTHQAVQTWHPTHRSPFLLFDVISCYRSILYII